MKHLTELSSNMQFEDKGVYEENEINPIKIKDSLINILTC